METPEGNPRRSWPGPQHGPGHRGSAGGTRAAVLGSLTIPGRPEQVATARTFVAQTLSSHRVGADHDAAPGFRSDSPGQIPAFMLTARCDLTNGRALANFCHSGIVCTRL